MQQRPFSLLIKPSAGDCNLRCEYCFYLEPHGANYYADTIAYHRMSMETAENMIRKFMQWPQPFYSFSWQGGEPTLMGLDFYKQVVNIQKKYLPVGKSLFNGLQTNGVLLDTKWGDFLAKEHFLTGISLDGPQYIHDHYRHRCEGQGSFQSVWRGIQAMKATGAEFNILTLVNNVNVKHPEEVYRFLTDNGFYFHQYIPCVEPDNRGGTKPYSICGEEWGDFLIAIFDLWYAKDTRKVSVRHFDSVFNLLVTDRREQCTICNNCDQYLVVDFNGDIYPCDFFVEKRLLLGNINNNEWAHCLYSPIYTNFGKQKIMTHPQCQTCRYNWLCVGDCLKHRFCSGGGDPHRLSHLCKGWLRFYDYALPKFVKLAEKFVRETTK